MFTQHNTLALTTLISAFALAGCQSTQTTTLSPLLTNAKQHIGWISGECFAIKNAQLEAGDTVHVVNVTNNQRQAVNILSTNATPCQKLASQQTAVSGQQMHTYYQVDRVNAADPVIALLGNPKTLANYHYQSCTLSNGTFFYITAPQGQQLWSDSFYSGEKTLPTCSSDLFR
ncbi:hypothetical protein ACFFLZ_03875 [Photobacterium aphoticum]|uniref:Lipoprotein n=1 Tax=Photobacterium aphoticum TaxID=754436 RepID=A0A0J1GRY3_9GAMM|nr:hypothetical protein [Photobacterium aphoticum]KLV02508.1 hypothetical protein ABT58_03090 [Photobacterium aphoticum]PSU56925.1 hypothetical protein C9I90_11220 [Photobacterium aphoticum]GHA64550.1 hypothetical protein GCM10007086_42800 [Photobacterium aphoticum]